MSILTVTTITTANATTDLTLRSGNSSGAGIIVPANGQSIIFQTNSTVNAFTTNTTAVSFNTNTATFGTAVYIVSNGNVGIGTSVANSKLHIHQANGYLSSSSRFLANTTTRAQIHISANTNGANGTYTYQYGLTYEINGSTQAGILISENGSDGTAIGFYDTNSYAAGPQLRSYIDPYGMFLPGASNTYDLGSTSLRWRNLYTNDLNLSNGIGDYTIVEGEEDLFLYNNKSNKVFKFALIEVDPSEAPKKAT